ncbi:hypothetical protein FOIG_03020 [Fusarium odoratissimum NRRL 54006]|uniref:Uncharacterized protein n=1 Tax=Fusarium odoratissimum (strain NRRL 54006) TaxID=1089451 RepID=X0LI72_FUSO5|nr:uncharacterized protein FOIG_03020 [Fusarium odoratissimum NRRL 54006]EXM08320.1 hypothetical protein FOIG_03020 [Fusarium odoratissimum NRRL 54006]
MDMAFLCLAALSVESHLDPFVDDISGSTVASETIGRLIRLGLGKRQKVHVFSATVGKEKNALHYTTGGVG